MTSPLEAAAEAYVAKAHPTETSEFTGEGIYRFKDLEEAHIAGAQHILSSPELKAVREAIEFYAVYAKSGGHPKAKDALAQLDRLAGGV